MTRTRAVLVALTGALSIGVLSVGCSKTVTIPIEIDGSDPSCEGNGDGDGNGFRAECAASVEALFSRQGEQTPQRQCIELAAGLSDLDALPSALENVSFPGLAEGDMVQMTLSVFSQTACMGSPFATGTSELATIDSAVSSILVALECSAPDVCNDDQNEFVAVVREIFGDQGDGDGQVVTVGYSTTTYAVESSLSSIGNNRYSGQLAAGEGCVSVALDAVFGELPYVSCLSATGLEGGDHFAFAASQERLVEAFQDAGLAVPRTVLGKVVGDTGSGLGSVSVSVEDDVDILYFDSENDVFVTGESTLASGIFAIRPGNPGCCLEVNASNNETEVSVVVQPLTNGVAAARIVFGD